MTETELKNKAYVYSRRCFRAIPFDIKAVRKVAFQAYIDGYKLAKNERDYEFATKAQELGG